MVATLWLFAERNSGNFSYFLNSQNIRKWMMEFLSLTIFFFQRYFSTVFLEWNIHSMERQYELQYSSAIEKNTVFTRLFLHQRYRRHQNDETLFQNLFKNILIGPKTDHCLDLSQTHELIILAQYSAFRSYKCCCWCSGWRWRWKGGKYLENDNIWSTEEKKNRVGKGGGIIWRRKIIGDADQLSE